MKPIISLLLVFIVLSCNNDRPERNPYIQEIGFQFNVNLNLPLYSPLTNPGSPVYIGLEGIGNKGVFIINTGFDQFRAFEASCPNHIPSSCSTMEIKGQNAICTCEDYKYSLFTGQQLTPPEGKKYYNMLEYRAVKSGNSVIISN